MIPSTPSASAQGSGSRSSPKLSIDGSKPIPWSRPLALAKARAGGRHPEHPRLEGSPAQRSERSAVNHSPDGATHVA